MNRPRAVVASLVVACTLPLSVGCGGGLPLLYPARTLPLGEVRALAGFSANVAVGGLADATRDAINEAAANPNAPSVGDTAYARGALASASVGPGLAPIVGARVGVGSEAEGGIVYSGRSVHADLRKSFELSPKWSLSLGAGGSAVLQGGSLGGGASLPGVDLGRLHGWGADVPVLLGYQSDGDLYMAWLGARGGWEHAAIDAEVSEAPIGPVPIGLTATRFWGGGLIGAAVGFRHLHVAMELDASYATVSGYFDGAHAHVAGVTLAPAAALWWSF
jgi:hypothetical protein